MTYKLPIAADDVEFEREFGTNTKCIEALFNARWADGFICPKCAHRACWRRHTRPGTIECQGCHFETTVTAGTLFHASKLPLFLLFKVVYLIVVDKRGVSALGLKRQLGVNYKTALLWLRKVRTAMVVPERSKLVGRVEVDESMLGGPAEGCQGRKKGDNQEWVMVYAEEAVKGIGRIRLVQTPAINRECIVPSVVNEVEKGSGLHTDGHTAYLPTTNEGYVHEAEVTGDPKSSSKKFPLVNRVASLLKRWLIGTLHGSWKPWWLQSLLDEFVFRFNRRKSKRRSQLFSRVIESGILRRPPTRDLFERYAAHSVKQATGS